MPSLLIQDRKTGQQATAEIGTGVVTVGRDETNDIVLEFPDVCGHHCEIESSPAKIVVRDFGTAAGTYLGKTRIRDEAVWKPGVDLRIGSCVLKLVGAETAEAPAPEPVPPPLPVAADSKANPPSPSPSAVRARPAAPPHKPRSARIETATPAAGRTTALYKSKVREFLVEHPEVKRLLHVSAGDAEMRETLRRLIREAASEAGAERPPGLSEETLVKEMLDEILGLGPLEDLMKDDSVQEIMVNRFDRILIERTRGGIEPLVRSFLDEDHLLETIRRILAPLGRHVNETTPLVDARLKDGTRINAVIPPIAMGGAVMTIRKFAREPFTLEKLVELNTITPQTSKLLDYAVSTRQNIVVSGGTGCGKTCFLNALGTVVPGTERMVVIEDTHELRFDHTNCVYLESRPASLEGKGEIPIRRLVINSLRMRPDRIIVGECRGDEAFDMLQAMNTGHLGSMTTVHSNSPRDAILRIENMTLMAGYELPQNAIRRQVVSALNLVVQLTRWGHRGERKVSSISEITGIEGNAVTMQELYRLDEQGALVATGAVPRFLQGLSQEDRARWIRAFGMARGAGAAA